MIQGKRRHPTNLSIQNSLTHHVFTLFTACVWLEMKKEVLTLPPTQVFYSMAVVAFASKPSSQSWIPARLLSGGWESMRQQHSVRCYLQEFVFYLKSKTPPSLSAGTSCGGGHLYLSSRPTATRSLFPSWSSPIRTMPTKPTRKSTRSARGLHLSRPWLSSKRNSRGFCSYCETPSLKHHNDQITITISNYAVVPKYSKYFTKTPAGNRWKWNPNRLPSTQT